MFKNNVVKNIIGTPKRGGKKDWDFDGVSNKKDCQPRNPMRQDMFLPSAFKEMQKQKKLEEEKILQQQLKEKGEIEGVYIIDRRTHDFLGRHPDEQTARKAIADGQARRMQEFYDVIIVPARSARFPFESWNI